MCAAKRNAYATYTVYVSISCTDENARKVLTANTDVHLMSLDLDLNQASWEGHIKIPALQFQNYPCRQDPSSSNLCTYINLAALSS